MSAATTLFVAVGLDGLRVASKDGKTWADAQTGREGESYRAVAFGNGLCVAVGGFGGDNILAVTSDGSSTPRPSHHLPNAITRFLVVPSVRLVHPCGVARYAFASIVAARTSTISFVESVATPSRPFSITALNGGFSFHSGCSAASAFSRSTANAACT